MIRLMACRFRQVSDMPALWKTLESWVIGVAGVASTDPPGGPTIAVK